MVGFSPSRLLDGSEFALFLLARFFRRSHDDHRLCRLGVGLERRSLLAAPFAWPGSAVWPSRRQARPPSLVSLLSRLGTDVGVVIFDVFQQFLEEKREPLLHEAIVDPLQLLRQHVELPGHGLFRDEFRMPRLPGVRRSVDEMLDLTEQLLRLVEDVLDFSGNGAVVVGLVLLLLHVQDQRERRHVHLLLLMPPIRIVL